MDGKPLWIKSLCARPKISLVNFYADYKKSFGRRSFVCIRMLKEKAKKEEEKKKSKKKKHIGTVKIL